MLNNNSNEVYDLWNMTRISEDDVKEGKESGNLPIKEMAKKIRKHLRVRFPMCKISVRSGKATYLPTIDVKIKSSPFERGSEEIKAISDYIEKYVEGYNDIVDYDPYGDYGNRYKFYGTYSGCSVVGYSYVQSDYNEYYKDMSKRFAKSKAEYDKKEREREEQEYLKRVKEYAEEQKRAEEADRVRKENEKIVEKNAVVSDVNFTIMNAIEPVYNKNDTIEEYVEQYKNDEYRRVDCEVNKAVWFDREAYEKFSNTLMSDYSFIAGTGGSRTYDNRIKNINDYYKMEKEERDTVKFILTNCVAVYCEDTLKFIVDAEGFDYCRYCLLVDNHSVIKSGRWID